MPWGNSKSQGLVLLYIGYIEREKQYIIRYSNTYLININQLSTYNIYNLVISIYERLLHVSTVSRCWRWANFKTSSFISSPNPRRPRHPNAAFSDLWTVSPMSLIAWLQLFWTKADKTHPPRLSEGLTWTMWNIYCTCLIYPSDLPGVCTLCRLFCLFGSGPRHVARCGGLGPFLSRSPGAKAQAKRSLGD